MSKLVDTELGQFRLVENGTRKWFLFECPQCREMLPMDEETLSGRKDIQHESRILPATFCRFTGTREFGKHLITTMQAQIVMGYMPYHDEGQDQWQSNGSNTP